MLALTFTFTVVMSNGIGDEDCQNASALYAKRLFFLHVIGRLVKSHLPVK
jgi:hypothetical protein